MSDKTPTFIIETTTTGARISPMAWPTKHCGRPSDAALAAHVAKLSAQVTITSAKVIRQSSGAVVATWTA